MVSFGSDSNKAEELHSKVDIHSKSLVSVVERQKDLENKVDVLDEKIELLDHNSIREIKQLSQSLKFLRDEIHDIKADLEHIKEFQLKVKKQFKIVTTKDEVQKLERYIDLWNPMDFATKDEVLEMRDKIIDHIKDDIESFLKKEDNKKTNSKKPQISNTKPNSKK